MRDTGEIGWQEHAREELRRAGARSRGARRTLIEFLASQDCCLSAHELFDALRAEGRTVGIATVYRVLDQMVDLQLVHRVDFGDGINRFEYTYPGTHHHHLVCRTCGKVTTFDDPALELAITEVAHSHGYAIDDHHLVLHGACPACPPDSAAGDPAPPRPEPV